MLGKLLYERRQPGDCAAVVRQKCRLDQADGGRIGHVAGTDNGYVIKQKRLRVQIGAVVEANLFSTQRAEQPRISFATGDGAGGCVHDKNVPSAEADEIAGYIRDGSFPLMLPCLRHLHPECLCLPQIGAENFLHGMLRPLD